MTRLSAITLTPLLALLGVAATAFGQSSITLRPAARVEPGKPVLLGDIALLDGPGAGSLAEIAVLALAPAHPRTITTDDLRSLLAPARVSWGSTTLSGASCRVVAAPPAATEPALVPQVATPDAAPDPDSIRARLAARIAPMVDAAAADLRLSFSDNDAELLDTPVNGRVLEVRTVGASDRMALAITLYEADRIVASKTIRVGVQVRRTVITAAGGHRRGDVLSDADISTDRQWLPPGVIPAPRERVIGAAVRNRLNPGELITEQHLSPPVVVEKGDQVMVRCLAGTVVVTMRARALGEARDGEPVRLESLDRPGHVFEARMQGRGRAVLVSALLASPRARKERNQ